MKENQRQILDNFFAIKTTKYEQKYQVCYSTKELSGLGNLGIVYMGENITIELYEDKEDIQHYLRIMLDDEEWMILAVPPNISRAFANYLGFRLYSILYILTNEDSLNIMNDLRTDFLYQ